MAGRGTPIHERATQALAVIAERGGIETFPEVLTSREAIAVMGRDWFMHASRFGALPGQRAVVAGRWRCERGTFLQFLQDLQAGRIGNVIVTPEQTNEGTSYANADPPSPKTRRRKRR